MTRLHLGPTTLLQCIEYDWALCFRCMKCDHRAKWGALDLVERFRDSLRMPVATVNGAAIHCGEEPVCWMQQGGAMAAWEPADAKSISDPWGFRDKRLRAFLVDQGLPLALADERKAAGEAWRESL